MTVRGRCVIRVTRKGDGCKSDGARQV
ncbi:hypothetical protein E2C01_093930 [Portunus trituberculatus]|uniref:Uncharacterized protein n=1 Tax=Portunus trituberculatus TaxID=210409 RepID=A0A5B7JW73_PORTR|nr:hypothetical protein [Portunus trituberculatus]